MQHEDDFVKPQQVPPSVPAPSWYEDRQGPVLAWVARDPPPAQDVPTGVVQVPVQGQGRRKRSCFVALLALIGSVLALLAIAVATSFVIDYLKGEEEEKKVVVVKNYYKVPNRRAMEKIMAGLVELDEYEEDGDHAGFESGFMQDYEDMLFGSEEGMGDELFHVMPISEEEEKYYAQLEEEKAKTIVEDDKASGRKKKKNDKDVQSYKPKARRLLVSSPWLAAA